MTFRRPALDSLTCTFKSVETYWDFYITDAVEFVSSIINDLKVLAPRADVVWSALNLGVHEPNSVSFEIDANSPRVVLRMRSEETVKIYAKTNTRVRFEFEHKSRQLRNLFGGQRFDQFEDFQAKLMSSIPHVTARFQNLLSALSELTWTADDLRPPHEFIHAIVQAVPDIQLHGTIISLLVHEGRLVRGRGRNLLDADVAEGRFVTQIGHTARRFDCG